MPRNSLKRSPCWKTTSPGASSVPASIEPSITVSAPAATAFATSPDEAIPPSPITGTPRLAATPATSWTAVTWGTPTPETTRVVQIEPGPIPTLTASAPASIKARVPSAVATLPAAPPHEETPLDRVIPLDPPHGLDHVLAVAVRRIDDQDVDVGLEQRADPLEVVHPHRR